MLDRVTPHRASHSVRSYLLPIGTTASLILWLIPLSIGTLASTALLDPIPLAMTGIIGLLGVLSIGGSVAIHEVRIDEGELKYLVSLLDRTSALHRDSKELSWSRFKSASVFKSDADNILIERAARDWIVRGRRHDILSVAAAINSRRENQGIQTENSGRELR